MISLEYMGCLINRYGPLVFRLLSAGTRLKLLFKYSTLIVFTMRPIMIKALPKKTLTGCAGRKSVPINVAENATLQSNADVEVAMARCRIK